MTAHLASRRALLKGAALLTAAPFAVSAGGVRLFDVVGTPEPIPAETPILRLFRQWEGLLDEANAAADAARSQGTRQEDAVWASFAPERQRIEDAIQAAPLADLRDLAVKVLVLTGEGGWALPDETVLECAALAGRDFGKMPRGLFTENEKGA